MDAPGFTASESTQRKPERGAMLAIGLAPLGYRRGFSEVAAFEDETS